MARPWTILEKAETPDGVLELRRRGERDFLILIDNRVLMNSAANRSETALGEAVSAVSKLSAPRVLIGGLGMALTLRAALDLLPPAAIVIVAELNEVVLGWCRGPLGMLTGNAVRDPRVTVVLQDVADVIARAGSTGTGRFDVIIIDLYEGPGSKTDPVRDPFYGSRALNSTRAALNPGGIFGVWGENPDAGFEKRLKSAGFTFDCRRPGRGGLRHVVYFARKTGRQE